MTPAALTVAGGEYSPAGPPGADDDFAIQSPDKNILKKKIIWNVKIDKL